jgi:peptidylprolyl isomerase
VRRPHPGTPVRLLAACAALASAAACSGGDGAADPAAASVAGPDSVAGTTTAVAATAPPTTAAVPRFDPATCDDTPDVTVPPSEEPVTVVRPCTIPDELQIFVINEGRGRGAQNGDTLIVDYTGIRASDGEMFDMSYLRGVPLDFELGRGNVILGWDIGLLGARAGEVVRLDVPGDQAYGDSPPSDEIPPDEALTFLVQVRAVIPPVTADDAPLDLLVEPSEGATEVTWVDVTTGDGGAITPGSTAVVHVLLVRGDNLKVLLNTWERSDPLQILMADGQTLPGILTGLEGATVGTTRVISMPPAEAFGPEGEPGLGLPAGVDLIVVAEVVGVY